MGQRIVSSGAAAITTLWTQKIKMRRKMSMENGYKMDMKIDMD
jgi:hypothetical protein